mgnify:CR=1 FL=1
MGLIIILILLTGCSAKFDGYDPTTAMLRWIITNDKKFSVQTSSSPYKYNWHNEEVMKHSKQNGFESIDMEDEQDTMAMPENQGIINKEQTGIM